VVAHYITRILVHKGNLNFFFHFELVLFCFENRRNGQLRDDVHGIKFRTRILHYLNQFVTLRT